MRKHKKAGNSILVISDMHIPYHHKDTVDFLKAIKKEYKPDQVICVGDEVDKHAMSFHDSDPDLMAAGDELEEAIKALQDIYDMFPEVDLVDSNHGSMVYRKGKHHGIPRKYLRDYGEVLESPKGWQWHNDLTLRLSNGQDIYICHGMMKDGMKLAQRMGMNCISGHYHTEFSIKYASSPNQLYWSLQVGCLIDDKSLAFHYNKTTATRPIIGTGMVLEGQPLLLPMILDKKGRWIGELL